MKKGECPKPSWHHLPIFLGVSSLCGMVLTYALAKKNCHVEKWVLPYISYTGTEHPESSVFGLLLNTEGFLGIVVVTLAWRFMQHVDQRGYLNNATLLAGILSCFGVIMVGNFQVSKTKVPHYVGAGLAFIIGTVYCALSSALTLRLHRSIKDKPSCSMFVCILRFIASFSMIVSIVILSILGTLRLNYNSQHYNNQEENVTSQPKIEGEPMYRFPNGSCVPIINTVPVYKRYLDLAGSITEWLLTACLLFTLALYAYEFKYFFNVKVVLKKHGTEISLETLQKKQCRSTLPCDTSHCSTSPNASLLHEYNDSAMRQNGEKISESNRSSGVIFCKNNNKDTCTFGSNKNGSREINA